VCSHRGISLESRSSNLCTGVINHILLYPTKMRVKVSSQTIGKHGLTAQYASCFGIHFEGYTLNSNDLTERKGFAWPASQAKVSGVPNIGVAGNDLRPELEPRQTTPPHNDTRPQHWLGDLTGTSTARLINISEVTQARACIVAILGVLCDLRIAEHDGRSTAGGSKADRADGAVWWRGRVSRADACDAANSAPAVAVEVAVDSGGGATARGNA
jgi:hypothetical protein